MRIVPTIHRPMSDGPKAPTAAQNFTLSRYAGRGQGEGTLRAPPRASFGGAPHPSLSRCTGRGRKTAPLSLLLVGLVVFSANWAHGQTPPATEPATPVL